MEETKRDSPLEGEELTKGDNPVPNLVLGEKGYSGLNVLGGNILEECQHELRFPESIQTFKKMSKDGAIAPALELVEMMIARVPWTVSIPEGYEESLKTKAEYLKQVMGDMEHSWKSFIKQVVSYNRYGFCVNEKVFRYRRKDKGSKYDDGLIGLKKLPIRSQDSILDWVYKDQGRELAGLVQQVNIPSNSPTVDAGFSYQLATTYLNQRKLIPRSKFILFRNNPLKDSPLGQSSLSGCWQSWKYKQSYQEAEALAAAYDSSGFKILYLPPQYMAEDASPENKAIYAHYQKMLQQASRGELSSFILPMILDGEGNNMFKFEIQNISGSKSYDLNQIISRYTREALTALFADFLTLGDGTGGSYSLSESKLSVVEMAIQAKLDEIKDQVNHDLVKQLFELNGWNTDVMPEITYGPITKPTLDDVSKWTQRVSATGNLPKNREVINWVLESADIPYRVPEDMSQEDLLELLGKSESRSGDGLASETGGLNGTGDSVDRDNSTSNTENT